MAGQRAWPKEWPITPTRGPPEWEWDFGQRPVEEVIETIPAYQFDQRISW
jgi:hypothetical protein